MSLQEDEHVDIALIYASDSTHLAGTFCALIDDLYPDLNIDVRTVAEQSRYKALESAHRIVIFISEKFLTSKLHVLELHSALNRQRSSTKNILYLIQSTTLTSRPFFPRLLPYNIVCSDPIWTDLETEHLDGMPVIRWTVISKKGVRLEHARKFKCYPREHFAMEKAADDILENLIYNK